MFDWLHNSELKAEVDREMLVKRMGRVEDIVTGRPVGVGRRISRSDSTIHLADIDRRSLTS